jgi:hypothetical protein
MTISLPIEAGYAYSPSDTPNLDPLKELDQWVVWMGVPKDGGGFRKMAIHPETHRAKGYRYSKPENQMPYPMTRAIAEGLIARTGRIYGVSFVPNLSGSFVVIDLDKVFDLETGEVLKPWALDLAQEISSYTEVSPSRTGLRIIVFGVGDFSGHYRIEGYPPEHVIEAYNKGQHLSITENPFPDLDVPITNVQPFLDLLTPANPSRAKIERKTTERAEVELPGDLEAVRGKVKRVLTRLDIPTVPIIEPGRHNTLIHYGARVYATGNFAEDEFWEFLVAFNATMLYGHGGNLEGLPKDELGRICDYILRIGVEEASSDKGILRTLDAVLTDLNGMAPRMRSRLKVGEVGLTTTDRKTVVGLCLHGTKKDYARFVCETKVRIYCSKAKLLEMSRVSDPRTSNASIKRLSKLGVLEWGKESHRLTGHFDLDLVSVRDPDLWTGGSWEAYALSPPLSSPYIGGIGHKFHPDEVLKHLNFHHRGLGEAKKNIVLAVLSLGGEARTMEIANRMGRASTDISRALADLCRLDLLKKVSYGRYTVADDLELALHNARVRAQEFERDEKIEAANRERRIASRYYFDLLDAMERGESPAFVKPPPDLNHKHIENIKAKASTKDTARKREAEEIAKDAEAISAWGTPWESVDPLDHDPEPTADGDLDLSFQ